MASIGVALGARRWLPPAARGVANFFRGFAVVGTLPEILPTLSRISALDETVSRVLRELSPNGGSSLRDVVNDTRTGVARTEAALALFVNSTRAQWDGMGMFGVVETDSRGEVTYVNGTFQRWTLRNAHEMFGHGWVNVIAPNDRACVREEWESCVSDEREFNMTYRMVDMLGHEFEVAAVATPVREGPNGPVVKWVGVIRRTDGDNQGKTC